MLNIHRIDHEASHTHCWRVTVQRRTRIYVRSFSDGRYGGAEQALVAATTYRDALIRSNPPLSKPVYCAILKKTNRSGVSGLSRIDRWEFSKGRRVHRLYWDVQWPIENCQSRHKKFSILKYGRWGVSTGPQGQGGRSQGDLVTDVFPIRVERRGKQCSCIGVVGQDCRSAFGL